MKFIFYELVWYMMLCKLIFLIEKFSKIDIKSYVCYIDDLIFIHRDKDFFRYALFEIERLCKGEFRLSLNRKTQIGLVRDGIGFLGYRYILNSNGSITRKCGRVIYIFRLKFLF